MREHKMAFERQDYDPVTRDEARHDRECETAREVREALVDQEVEDILQEIDWGEYDNDMFNYFPPAMLMRIARIMATKDLELAFSLVGDDLLNIRAGRLDYARNLAETRVE